MAAKDKDARAKALETALGQIDRQFGKGSAMRLGDAPPQRVAVIPTGSLALDVALGIGGLPRGRVVEIYSLNHLVKQRLRFMQLLMRKSLVVLLLLLMLSTHLIQSMRANLVWILMR